MLCTGGPGGVPVWIPLGASKCSHLCKISLCFRAQGHTCISISLLTNLQIYVHAFMFPYASACLSVNMNAKSSSATSIGF